MRVLGLEGTAWAASAALYDTGDDGEETLLIESEAYQPDSGGLHPREAAEHMADELPGVIDRVLDRADEDDRADGNGKADSPAIDCVAFSRGPGLGPCLRIVGTAARAAAARLDVPLVGVNHMVAHLEIGRHESGFEEPVCLNASGANAHLLGYHNGRYRVLGETMDTGVGNAIDKFTRHVGWSHPGGPEVERAAADGEYVELPYVVKGMDFSFSGIMSAAKDAYDDGVPVEDVCFSLQEHIFAMLTEVSERALSLTGSDELVLGGGVGQNDRLREMLETMCEERGAAFYAPEARLLRDNAGMIAVLGAKMYAAGDTLAIEDSAIDPNFRPDEVEVTWRSDEPSVARRIEETDRFRGAEAIVETIREPESDRSSPIPLPCVEKRRQEKAYRHQALESRLRRERTAGEARLLRDARQAGVPTPLVWDVDPDRGRLIIQHVGSADLADRLEDAGESTTSEESVETAAAVGRALGRLHAAGLVHGDPTTRNVRVDGDRIFLIDFGLGYHSGHVEDHAMDIHVFKQSIEGTAAEPEPLCAAVERGYLETGEGAVVDRLRTIEGRGRYRGETE